MKKVRKEVGDVATQVREPLVPPKGKALKRMTCRICDSPDLNEFLALGKMPLANAFLNGASPSDVHALLSERYADERCVNVLPLGAEAALDGGYLSPIAANDTNRIDLMVFGNDTHTLLVSRYDNLGKGASGAAAQCLNLMLGVDELNGLTV